MPDKVEEILRAIHLLFSEAEKYDNSPEWSIINKKEMFSLLEKLNYVLLEVMDEYEATVISKERAKMEKEQEGQEIIEAATRTAEDVYAASLLYTRDALGRVHSVTEAAKKRIQEEYARLEEEIGKELSGIVANREILVDQLTEMIQDKKYLRIIEEENRKERAKQAESARSGGKASIQELEDDDPPPKREEIVIKVNEWPPRSGNKKAHEADEREGEDSDNPEHIGHFSAEDFDLDMEFFQWQEEQEGKQEPKEAERGNKRSFLDRFLK